ncbi:MAG TPA: CheR family methyltransferase [Leptospiraceae bacterium]|nr:CheR family methyltransferase [Leptospiraceae bacterium]HMX34521.1 CheR family methyltransferase [Leptospiraceae bacterium]HMY33064.1 CheR family methyltransferase [Leptospiraceae bacterium]HMZ66709.1 CheR family methyltransferase [Leptospiraceae bacterium]HNA09161.1 CheR family methyltransferase [Leptospiraceae bacterium]
MTDFFGTIVNIDDREFNYLKDIIYEKTGISLAPHKKIMLQSRLNIRLRHNQLSSFVEYVYKLKNDRNFMNSEIPEIINRITTNKTDFFRENHHFEFLKTTCFPLFEEKAKTSGKRKIRIWSSASSTGEEPYTLAMTVNDYFIGKPGWDIKIYASDIDTNVLDTAQRGVYREDRMAPVKPELRTKYFTSKITEKEKEYIAKPVLKDLLIFKKINLLEDPYPIQEKIDIIFCRNVIIYFDKQTQQKIFSQMEKILTDDGFLIIGHSETLFGISDNFKFLGHTIYQKKSPNGK